MPEKLTVTYTIKISRYWYTNKGFAWPMAHKEWNQK